MHDRTAVLGALSEGALRARLGRETEDYFFYSIESWKSPPLYYWGIRRATAEEDADGDDGFVRIDIGEVPIQIKRSQVGAEKYLRQYPGRRVLILVIRPGLSERDIRSYFGFRLEQWRVARLRQMTRWRPEWMPILRYSYA